MPPAATLRELLAAAAARLAAAGVDAPRLSARLLAAHVLRLDPLDILTRPDLSLSPETQARFEALVARRAAGEPVAYLVGEKEFYGLGLAVGPGVLVPRPETEHLVEAALAFFAGREGLRFADLGSGSGALAVALATHLPRSLGLAVERSAAALRYVRQNLAAHGLAARVLALRADFGRSFCRPASLDLVVANPPYVSAAEYAAVSREVAAFEPGEALTPGETGLEALDALLPQAVSALQPGGLFLCEIGAAQGPSAIELVAARPELAEAAVLPDLAGLDRVVRAVRRSC